MGTKLTNVTSGGMEEGSDSMLTGKKKPIPLIGNKHEKKRDIWKIERDLDFGFLCGPRQKKKNIPTENNKHLLPDLFICFQPPPINPSLNFASP